MQHPRTRGLLAAAALFLAACAPDAAAPAGPRAPGKASFSQATLASVATPNAVKYRDAGAKPSTGRAGSAAIELRALLGKDGLTQVEASSGSLEAGTHPGTIQKTQVKVLVGHAPARNYNGLAGAGYWTATYAGLARLDSVQVQSNVSGIDPRVDVVTTTATVYRRPDLAVRSVTGPAQAITNSPVTFIATVSELNGDVGARSDCVLFVDGTPVARAKGIWVDAGGTVTCQFTHSFGSTGTYTVEVAAAHVNPGDWDTANNSASTTIAIVDPGQAIAHGYLSADELDYRTSSSLTNDGPYPLDETSHTTEALSQTYFAGWDAGAGVPNSGLERIDATVSHDGIVDHTVSLTPQTSENFDNGQYFDHCATYFAIYWDGERYVTPADQGGACSYGSDATPEYRWVSYAYWHSAGDVTYYASGTDCEPWGCDTYTHNTDHVYGAGTSYGWAVGTNVRVQVAFVDADASAHTTDHTVLLQDLSSLVNWTQAYCTADQYRGGTTCVNKSSSGIDAHGYVRW